MNTKNIAKIIVLNFYQGHGKKIENWLNLSKELEMSFTEKEIQYGIDNVFYNNDKKWKDWNTENGLGMQLYGLRMFVSNSLDKLRTYPILCQFEDEVDRVEGNIIPIVKFLKKMGIKFKKPWWKFWN